MDLNNVIQNLSSGQQPSNVHPQLGQWVQNYQQGAVDQVPHDEVHQAYTQYAQNTDPQDLHEATSYGYQQVPPQHRTGIAGSLLDMFQKHGMSPQAAGVQTTDPQQMTPQDMSRMTQYAHQEQPDALKQLFQPGGALSNPMVGMALAGALAFGASKMMGGRK